MKLGESDGYPAATKHQAGHDEEIAQRKVTAREEQTELCAPKIHTLGGRKSHRYWASIEGLKLERLFAVLVSLPFFFEPPVGSDSRWRRLAMDHGRNVAPSAVVDAWIGAPPHSRSVSSTMSRLPHIYGRKCRQVRRDLRR